MSAPHPLIRISDATLMAVDNGANGEGELRLRWNEIIPSLEASFG